MGYHKCRYLPLSARRNRTAKPAELGSSIAASSRKLASRSTMRQRLHERGLYPKRAAIFVQVTSHHRRERLQWKR
ncbi:hypothetical protein TNCV_2201 [Trichonephila clavipes]|nr:hypothetical protein TNCV_2201 [Trichonephila clavipes]